jgi:hypothetical protein
MEQKNLEKHLARLVGEDLVDADAGHNRVNVKQIR